MLFTRNCCILTTGSHLSQIMHVTMLLTVKKKVISRLTKNTTWLKLLSPELLFGTLSNAFAPHCREQFLTENDKRPEICRMLLAHYRLAWTENKKRRQASEWKLHATSGEIQLSAVPEPSAEVCRVCSRSSRRTWTLQTPMFQCTGRQRGKEARESSNECTAAKWTITFTPSFFLMIVSWLQAVMKTQNKQGGGLFILVFQMFRKNKGPLLSS